MLFRKEGYPEDSELVMCTVTKVLPHSVFVNMDEYGKSGMIHISEISPGRIRNIREFVVEDKVIVCKVLRVNLEKGHIDLSLRRVTEGQRRNKVDGMKQEQVAEKILEYVTKELKKDLKSAYQAIMAKITKDYDSLHACFEDVSKGIASLEEYGIEKPLAEQLTEIIRQRMKLPEVEIKGILSLKSYASDGVEVVKGTLKKVMEKASEKATLRYGGAGRFNINIKAEDYKEAEMVLEGMLANGEKHMKKHTGEFSFRRDG